MVKLRFARVGRKNIAIFKIVAQDSQVDPFGRVIEILGFYNPKTKEKRINAEKVKEWIKKGAQITDSLYNLLITEKIIEGKKRNVYSVKKKHFKKDEGSKQAEEIKKEG